MMLVRNRALADVAKRSFKPEDCDMMCLVLSCDLAGDRPLGVENELRGPEMPVRLPPELLADLLSWNERMSRAVLAATETSSATARLNAEGENLASRIASVVPGGAKVRYLKE